MWGIHNDQSSIDPVADRAIRVGWEEVGDLSSVPTTRDAFKAVITERMPDIEPKTIAGSAGTSTDSSMRSESEISSSAPTDIGGP